MRHLAFNSKENEMHQCLVWDLCSEIGAEHCQDTWLHGRRCIVPFLLSWTCHDFHKTLSNNLTHYFYWSSYYCSILHFPLLLHLLLPSLIPQQLILDTASTSTSCHAPPPSEKSLSPENPARVLIAISDEDNHQGCQKVSASPYHKGVVHEYHTAFTWRTWIWHIWH